ncbi:MAG: dCMP deaminase family protein [Oscillospiraceae bacterium]|nr:dCMP deaminase family protein [Oscillospiraceae bacterium]
MKRQDYITWDEYFMGIALLSARRSKDPGTQVGACIISSDKRILTMGYNGMPIGCSDDEFPWAREGSPLDTKYLYVCHAEMNAILNSGTADLRGSHVYTTLFPCAECTKALIQKGITEVCYLSDKYADEDLFVAARRMMDAAGVRYRQYKPTGREITIRV